MQFFKFFKTWVLTGPLTKVQKLQCCHNYAGRIRFHIVLFVFAALAVASLNATAQITTPFSIRYSTNQNGDIKLIGNALMTCPVSTDCVNAQQGISNGTGLNNNNFALIDVDIDGDTSTFSSSRATLSMPAGSTVLFAGLYWAGTSASGQRGQVLFRTPSSFGYSTVSASTLSPPTAGHANNYAGFANVTSAVAAAGNGTYTIANVQRTLGADNWAGWVLTVVYQNNSETLKNLVVYDGYGLVNNANPVTIVPTGFLTPLSGPVTTRVGAAGFDGDLGLIGDGFSVNGTALTDSLNVGNNFFNSVISENGVQLPGRIPSFSNNLGTDIDRVNVPTGVVPNGATSATLQLTAPNENYHPVLITFATDLYVPIITQNITKTASDLNGGPLLASDVMRWTIAMSNTGQDTGTNLILKDPIPLGTTYLPGSLVIISGANAGTKTDTVADDQAEFSNVPATCSPVASPCVIFRLGSGATGAAGGNLAFNEATSLRFDTTVNAGLPAGTLINNTATISYSGQTQGASFSTTSASATGTSASAPAIAKSFTPAVVNVGGTSTLTVVLSNPASNPVSLTGVTFADIYPAGITNSAAPGSNVVCTAGSTPGTVTGGVASGNTLGMTPGATILAGGNCTVTVQVTATAAGTHVNTTGNVGSTNAGTGTNASATLFVGKVSITKSFSAPTFEVGQNSTITFVLTNNTGIAVAGVAFSDVYPGGISNTAVVTNGCGGTVTAAAATSTLSLTGGSLGIGASCTITKQVAGSAGGNFTNTTTGVTRTGDAVPGNPASAPYTVVEAPTIVKTFSPNPVNVGDFSQISITITNPNATTTVTRTGAVFLDTYPGGLTNTNPTSVTLNCSPGSTAALTGGTGASGGNTIGLSDMTLHQAGGSCTVTTAVVATAGNKTNPAISATFDNAPDPTATAATLTVTTLTGPTVIKTFLTANPMAIGGTSVLQIDITNTNSGTAVTDVAFNDIYPPGLVNTGTPAATIAAQGGSSCTPGTLTAAANGNSLTLSGLTIGTAGTRVCRITVNVTAASRGTYVNTTGPITVANTPPGVAATGTLNVVGPPTITKSFTPAAIAGGAATSVLTIVIANPGTNPVALSGVSFSDTYPTTPGVMQNAANDGQIICTAGSTGGSLQDSGGGGLGNNDVGLRIAPTAGATILPNGSCTITQTVDTSGVAGNYVNTTTAVVSTNPAQTGLTATATLTVARLGIAKAFAPTTIVNGAVSVITFTISNPTGGGITGLAFTDALPAGMTMSSATLGVGGSACAGVASNAAIGVTNFAVTAGNVPTTGCTVSMSVTSAVTGTNNNQSSGASYTGFPTPGTQSNIATLVVQAAPTVAKSFAPAVIAQNGTSLLTITLANPNAVAITAAAFTDTYPSGVVNTGVPNGTTTCPGGAVIAAAAGTSLAVSGATIPANSACIVTVNVTSATAGTYVNTFPANGLTSSGGSNLSAASGTLTVLLPPTVAKSFSPTGVAISENSLLTITLSNPNATAITGAAFTDTYPADLRNALVPNASTSCPNGTFTATPNSTNPGVLTFAGGTIPANGSCTVTVSVVSLLATNYTNNTGAVTTTNAGSGTAATAILSVGVPSIAKIFSPNPVQLGQNSTLTFTITNGTPTPMTSVGFSDTFPVVPGNMRVASPATFTNTCGGTYAPVANAALVTLSGGAIPADSFCTLTVVVTTPTTGTYNNTSGNVSAAGPLTGNAATASLTVTQAVPTVNKVFATDLAVGGTSLLTFTVTQPATNPTQPFSFTDTLPAGLVVATPNGLGGTCTMGSSTAVAGSNTITFTNNQITNPATTCTLFVNVTTAVAPAPGNCTGVPNANTNNNINTTTNITAAITPSATSGVVPSAGACVTVLQAPTVAKAIAAGSDANIPVRGTTRFQITLGNASASAVTLTSIFTDTLPPGIVVAAIPNIAGTCTNASITAVAGSGTISYASGASILATTGCTILVDVSNNATTSATISNGSGTYTNTIAIGALATTAGSNAATASQLVNVVAGYKSGRLFADNDTSGTGNATIGDVLEWSVFYNNPIGGNAIAGFQAIDTIGASQTLVAGSIALTYQPNACSTGTANAGYNGAGTNTLFTAAFSLSASCTVRVTYRTTVTGGATLSNQASATGTALAATLTDNIDATTTGVPANVITLGLGANVFAQTQVAGTIDPTTVAVLQRPTITKAFAAANIASGSNTNLTVTIGNSNANPITLTAILTDTFPAGLTINTAGNTGTCAGVTAAAAANNFSMANGTNIPAAGCTVIVNVTSSTAGSANNTFAIGALQTTAGNNAAAAGALLNVYAPPAVTKTFTPANIGAGGTASMVITVTSPVANMGVISGVAINDSYTGTLVNNAAGSVVCSGAGSATLIGGVNAGNSVGFSSGSIVPGGTCTITQSVSATSTNLNTTTAPTATGPVALTGTAATATLTVAPPSLVFMKTVSVTWDPVNGATNPKNIPGAEVLYNLRVTNTGIGAVDSNTALITDAIPVNTELFVGDLGVPGSGPIIFVPGTSNLLWSYLGLGNPTDDLEFSNNGGTTWIYVPTPPFDPAVNRIRLNPKGSMAGASSGNPSFELHFRVRVK